ncbi:MAG: serine/threonine protein kinase, partial [Solirubrobacteraceae bacterium]
GDDGQYFLVMEYVDGKDLGAIQRSLETMRRRIPFDLVLHMGAEICEALEHAHSARAPDGKSMSLVHRDVSPSNVLLSRAGEVKLTDFGIAKRAESEATGHGAVRGKFAYISPEQARNEHLDPRSDVFSVGILIWELITNRRLFSGLGDIEALRAVREGQAPRPREIDGRLSAEVDALIMSALARDVRNRPTAGQLGAKLRSLRYALEITVGDPASELAKIIDSPDDLERQSIPKIPSASMEFELSEATVIRIHTADEFSLQLAGGEDVARAREVIHRFEEEETRQAQLSRDQLAFLRANALRDSGELPSASEPALPSSTHPALPGLPTRASDEMTHAREPLSHDSLSNEPLSHDAHEDAPTYLPEGLELSAPFESEATRLLGDRRTPPPEPARMAGGRRTPAPEPRKRLGTQPPPIPSAPQPRLRSPTPGGLVDRTPPPGTIHDRNPRGAPLAMPPSAHPPPPQLQPMPQLPSQPPPPILQPMP